MESRASRDHDFLFKLLLIGNSSVGKTSILLRYVDDAFNTDFQTTIGVDFKLAELTRQDKLIKLQLWDTAGQDRFRNIVASYYRGANGIILVYDITNAESFHNIPKWMEESSSYLTQSVPKLLIGNKADLSSQRQVATADAQEFATQHGMLFLETSAKTNKNIKAAFETMADSMLELAGSAQPALKKPEAVKIGEGTSVKQGYCC
jgi:Ras-related protein Rab-1A